MATFGELQTAVSKRLLDVNNVAVSQSDVALALNNAISYWKFRRFGFNQQELDLTLTIQDGTINIPSGSLVPDTDDGAFVIEYSNERWPLVKKSREQYNQIWTRNGYGIPKVYAYMSTTYECFPLPDRAYTLKCYLLKDYADLVNLSDTNDFTINAPRLIQLWALANLSGELRQDEKMETYYRGASNNEYMNLGVLSDKQSGTGKLTLESNLI